MGHCGLHSPWIDWVVKGFEQPLAWFCSLVYAWIGTLKNVLNTTAPKTNAEIPGTNKRGNLRNKRGSSRVLIHATICLHCHVAFIPHELYISHASVVLVV
jgi:hypothetical protein